MDGSGSDSDVETASYFRDVLVSLQSVKRPGSFCAGGAVQLPFPGVEITGIPGKIGLPISDLQAKQIIEKCSRAPFGRGEDTVVDTSVRCTWQLCPSQFSIKNSAWRKELNSLVGQVKKELGCDASQNVTCELYKLLLYEPGGFFKPHRDTEKTDGMFGTLVIQLLSDYSGGELVVSHGGKDKVFNFSGNEGCFKYHYAAFYADCQHEIKKVTEGYRFCLIYNLIYAGAGSTPIPADNTVAIDRIASAMKEWNEDAGGCNCPKVMAYLLEHKYCEASLSFSNLKNVDRAVGSVLLSVQQQEECDVYLAQVSVSQSWSADCYGYRYSSGYDVIEMYDEDISATHFISLHGQLLPIPSLSLSKSCIVPKELFELVDPDEEEYEEATGNEGATVERLYRWAALILWPSKNRPRVMGVDAMTSKLKLDIERAGSLSEQKQRKFVEVAKDLHLYITKMSSSSAAVFLCCLKMLNDKDLLHQFLSSDIAKFVECESFCDQILSLVHTLGLLAIKPALLTMVKNVSDLKGCGRLINKLFSLSLSNSSQSITDTKPLCKELAVVLTRALQSGESTSSHKSSSLSPTSAVVILQCLQDPQDESLVSQFLLSIATTETSQLIADQVFVDQLVQTGQAIGWNALTSGLQAIFLKLGNNVTACCDFLAQVVPCDSTSNVTDNQNQVCQELIKILVKATCAEKEMPLQIQPSYFYSQRSKPTSRSMEFVLNLLKLSVHLNVGKDVPVSLMNAFLRQPNRYPIITVIVPALEMFSSWIAVDKKDVLISLIISSIKVIENGPKGWSQNVSVSCTCQDCQSLQRFFISSTQTQITFRMAMAKRLHIERQLSALSFYVTHRTIRYGSPHTLVIDKTKKSYEHTQSVLRAASRLRILGCLQQGYSVSDHQEPVSKRFKKDGCSSTAASADFIDLT